MNKLLVAVALVASVSFTTVSADDWFVRFGAVNVSPNSDSGAVLPDALGSNSLDVEADTQFGFNVTYMIDDTWGIEVLGASIFKHDIRGEGSLDGADIGVTEHLPPTISAVYNFKSGDVRYHVGAGINYTKFFSDYPGADAQALGVSDLDLDASVGLSLKAGFDVPIADDWFFTANMYYIMIETEADIIAGNTTITTVDVDINPFVFMIGLGYSF